jgi:hypothetical protein
MLRKAFTLEELEAIEAKLEAAQKSGSLKELEAPAVVPDLKPVPDKPHIQDRSGVAAVEAMDQANEKNLREKRDPADDWRTGRGTEPGKLAGKPGCAAPTTPDPLGEGAGADGVVPSVPKARPSWRD